MLWRLFGLGALGYAGYRWGKRRERAYNAAFSANQPDSKHAKVRDAGPDAMRDGDEENWTETDEELDQTFPASDPPANY
ncbi:MAG: hypothetical protein AAF291_09820 [Pseudomonadota bacterium]